MFQFLLGVLILGLNFLGVSRAIAENRGADSGPGVMTMPIRGRACWAALTLALAPLLLPAAANAQNAYISNYGDGTVSVIDTAINAVVATVHVGRFPFGVAITPDGTKAYITNSFIDNTVSVIDTATNTVTATTPVGGNPLGIAVAADGTKAYIANRADGTVSVIATTTNSVTITIPVGGSPFGVAVTPDGTRAYVVGNGVSVIDTATDAVITTIPVGNNPRGVAVAPDGTKGYVANYNDGTVSMIATATNTVTTTIPVGNNPYGVAITPDGTKAYVVNTGDRTVSVIDTATNTVTDAIPVGRDPIGVAVTPDGTRAYAVNNFEGTTGGTVSVVDTATNTVAATIPVGKGPVAFGKFIGGPLHSSPPVAVNETVTTAANTPVTIDLTAGATGNPTSAAPVGTPVGGTVAGFPATTVTFTPTTGFSGAASFQFTLANAFGTSNTATATITVTPGPAPSISSVSPNPPTGSDSAQPFTINGSNFVSGANITLRDLTTGEVFPNRPASSFSSTQIVINPVFTTAAHSWSVEVINPDGQSSGEFGFLVIAPPNLPPVAMDQDVTATAGVAKTIDLSKNATGGIPTGAKTSKPAHGTISATFGTSVVYTANACYTGPDSFTFRLTNNFGQSNLAKVTITVNPASAPTIEVHLIDPYLLDAYKTNPAKIAEDSLFAAYNNPAIQAKGLVADGVSAAIAVVKTNACSGDVSVSTSSNGITLLPYDPTFLNLDLKNPPKPGDKILPPIKAAELAAKGGFAAVLVQAPIGPQPFPLFTGNVTSIDVAAQQGDLQGKAEMFLEPPPVVLVHGIWGDRTSLGGQDGAGFGTLPGQEGLAGYLEATIPWLGNPNFVQVVCYSKYFRFDADIDTILESVSDVRAGDSCEQTSRDAITSRIYGLLGYLDSLKIVGSRVDVVAHSMGGLAARNYASQPWYTSLRNRNQGQFHEIITLDTPELGSELARFLIDHKDCLGQGDFNPVWGVACGTGPIRIPVTVAQCFATLGLPLFVPGDSPQTGAVYSLFPPAGKPAGTAIKKLPDANIEGAEWRAISAVAPDNSNLKFLLNNLIAAIYPQDFPTCHAPGTAQTIDDILKDPNNPNDPNDAIVRLSSQLGNAQPGHSHKFPGLSHTGLPAIAAAILPPGLSNDNVLDCADVNRLVRCWLSRSGDSACLAGIPNPPACLTPVSASTAAPANKTAGLPASFTPVAANTAAATKSAVPMPHIVTKHPHSVDRLTLRAPAGLELGKPFDLAANTGSGGLPELHVVQSSETGTQKEVPVTISRVEGQTVHLRVTPKFFGATRFQVTAAYRDGGVAIKEVTANVDYPSGTPVEFHADELSFAGIPLPFPKKPADSGNPTLRLQPWAKWVSTGPRVYIDTSDVEYTIDPAPGSPVIKLSPTNGIIRGLKVGTATVTAQFRARPSTRPSKVQVNVADKQQ